VGRQSAINRLNLTELTTAKQKKPGNLFKYGTGKITCHEVRQIAELPGFSKRQSAIRQAVARHVVDCLTLADRVKPSRNYPRLHSFNKIA
jgi:hypothetical protein